MLDVKGVFEPHESLEMSMAYWNPPLNLKSSACFGTCTKSTTLPSVDQSTKKQKVQRNHRQGHTGPDKDFWTSSSNEMDHSTRIPRSSQRIVSSISPSNQNPETLGSNNNTNNAVFENHALTLWNEQRRDWVGNGPRLRPPQPRDPVLTWGSTYEELLGTSRPFVQPIPLPEMVNFLVDVWDQEGLYD